MIYNPFAIVTVPFPFTDKLHTKRRPAVVLSDQSYQMDTTQITLLMITSAKNSNWKSDYPITHLDSTGLTAPSIVRQKIFTIDLQLIHSQIGYLSDHDKEAVKQILSQHLSLN